MDFQTVAIDSEMQIHMDSVHGAEFFHDSLTRECHLPAKARFLIKRRTKDVSIEYPRARTRDASLTTLKIRYNELYGPYSADIFAKKAQEILSSMAHANKLKNNPRRMFIRKMWLVAEIFELFEKSMGLIVARMSKMIISIYERSIGILDKARIEKTTYGSKIEAFANKIITLVERVHIQLVEIIANNAKFLKLLTPTLLHSYAINASPYMVAKFGALSWIEPDTSAIVLPHYNFYWTEFWGLFFKRNFKVSEELCIYIAEYMPKYLQGETFLDYFRRTYDASNGRFLKKGAFDIKKCTKKANNIQLCTLTVLFDS